jgi:serine protease Do
MENETPIILPEGGKSFSGQETDCHHGSRKYCRRPCWNKIVLVVGVLLVAFAGGVAGAVIAPRLLMKLGKESPAFPIIQKIGQTAMTPQEKEAAKREVVKEDSLVVDLVAKSSPAVVSVVASKDVMKVRNSMFGSPFFDPFQSQGQRGGGAQGNGEIEKQQVGSGTGFFVSTDGLIVTNKHVVSDETADYSIVLSDKKEYPAKVLARDPVQDIAVIKVEGKDFPTLDFGDSSAIKVGQTVIAIGNSLGEFSNSVSKGIISGLGRSVTAGSGLGGDAETLTNIIQTDAAINPGNSGGPLLDISGQVIGINVAIARGAQNVGFSLPINQLKKVISDVKTTGRISTPYLGVRYAILDKDAQKVNNLPFNYGAIVLPGSGRMEFAVVPGSPADKAGIVENDIILEMGGQKLDTDHPLGSLLAEHQPGDTVTLKVWHKGDTKDVSVTIGERK